MICAVQVDSEPRCSYCTRRASSRYCGNCGRVLCDECYRGLGCMKRPPRCHSLPGGGGVR